MDDTCACCQSKMKFITQINGNFKRSIIMPESFLNHFRRKISGTFIRLETPNGKTYDVEVTENKNRAVFQSGWEAFVDANQIEENYSLMFRYLATSHFKVTVFDFNGMEKVLCCDAMKTASSVQKPSNYYSANCRMSAASYSSEESSAEDNPSVDEYLEPDDLQTHPKNYVLSGRCDLTKAQEAQIHALARKIQPKIPLLVAQMKKSNVKRPSQLTIRKDYAFTHFPNENQTIALQLPRKSKVWPCRFYIRLDRDERHVDLRHFVHDNGVQEGDICLLQPITKANARRFMVVVHLLPRESVDHSIDETTDTGSNDDRKSAKRAAAPLVSVKDEPASTDGEEISSSENEDHDVSDKSKDDSESEPLFILPKVSLTQAEEKKVLEKVESIRSALPIYVAIMKKTSVCTHQSGPTCILVFGLQYATSYLGMECAAGHGRKVNTMDLELQLEGRSMKWTAFLRRDGTRTTIQNGWRSFARDNRLRERDICLFELTMKNQKQLKMMVYIIRHRKC